MSKGENLSARYKDFAVYLPSLQQGYAQYAVDTNNKDSLKNPRPPKGFKAEYLNYLDANNPLWHCKYGLYSVGHFSSSRIENDDIVRFRDAKNTVIVGDSGGFQVGTGNLHGMKDLAQHKDNPAKVFQLWNNKNTRARLLRWLDTYTDYAMTLDMPLWVKTNPIALASPFRNFSNQTLIDMSVDNLRFFAENRTGGTKILNILQDIDGLRDLDNKGNPIGSVHKGTGTHWYNAVKDFNEFEGWAFGSETKASIAHTIKWILRLLNDGKLDGKEWIHILGVSPPIISVIYTALQTELRKVLGSNITISYDSSSPFQTGGVAKKYVKEPEFTKNLKSWKMNTGDFPFSPRHMDANSSEPPPFKSPITNMFSTLHAFHRKRESELESKFFDSLSEAVLTNHNIYMYHRYGIESCELAFVQKDYSKIPNRIIGALECIGEIFQTTMPDLLLKKHAKDLFFKSVKEDSDAQLKFAATVSQNDFLKD